MRFTFVLILSVVLVLFHTESKSQTIVKIAGSDGGSEKILFRHEKKIGEYNSKGKLLKISRIYASLQDIFWGQVADLTNYGITVRYPEIIYDDICVIADILSDYDQEKLKLFSHQTKEGECIQLENINTYYKHLNARVDYVYSFELTIKNGLISHYRYISTPNFSNKRISYSCTFRYDTNKRIVKIIRSYNQRNEYQVISYNPR